MDNTYGYEKMCKLYTRFSEGEITLPNFIDEFERICFNDISSRSMDYFSDGWKKACVSTLMKYFIRAMEGDAKAQSRIEVDLELVDVNFTIVPK